MATVVGVERVGNTIKYKFAKNLFSQYARNACERRVTECLFVDDSTLLALTRSVGETVVWEHQQMCEIFGLVVSTSKTNHIMMGRLLEEGDRVPNALEGRKTMQCMYEFQ